MHRYYFVHSPLQHTDNDIIADELESSISIVALPSSNVRITGPFRGMFAEYLQRLDIPASPPDKVLLPCFTRQISAIQHHFPDASVQKHNAFSAPCQASISTAILPNTSYRLKMALAYTTTDISHTNNPWTSCISPPLSQMLRDLVGPDLALPREFASVTGSLSNLDAAKHISVCLKANLEPAANVLDNTLILAAALIERRPGSGECHASVIFRLGDERKKLKWLSRYV